MTQRMITSTHRITRIAASVAVGAMLSALYIPAGAEQTHAPAAVATGMHARTSADLEHAFWHCDYAGTMGGADAGTAIACVSITDELKNRKFDGDFAAMLTWWRINKPRAHAAIEAANPRIAPASLTAR